jgi:CHASE3 domain sensor protein
VKLDAEKMIVAGFVAALALLLALGLITYRVTNSLVEDSGWVAHTYQVIGLLEDAETAVTNAETALRRRGETEEGTRVVRSGRGEEAITRVDELM